MKAYLLQFAGIVLFVLAFIGWLGNIYKIFEMADGPVTAMLIIRIVGVFFAPMGSLLGYM